jgi:hypothetical protein
MSVRVLVKQQQQWQQQQSCTLARSRTHAHVRPAVLARNTTGTAGGEAQQADIRQLLKELELKKSKLNELKGDSRKAEASIARIRDDDTDAQRLTPDGCVEETTYIQVGAQLS